MIGCFVADYVDYGTALLIGQVNDRCEHAFHGFLVLEGLSGSRGPVNAEHIDLDDPVERKSDSKAFGVAAAYGVFRGRRILDIHDICTVMTFEYDGPQEVITKAAVAGFDCDVGAQ